MVNSNKNCRVCGDNKNFDLNLFNNKLIRRYSSYLSRDKSWKNYVCFKCNAISHFPIDENILVRYKDSSYREVKSLNEPNSPISLPWSTITFLRAKHIHKYISQTNIGKKVLLSGNIKHLDFGGYNGFTAYGLSKYMNIKKSIIADLDPNGLKIANSIGMESFDLSEKSILDIGNNKIDICTAVHVIEHLESPKIEIRKLRSLLKKDGIIYVEVPNMFGCSLYDSAHLTNFNFNSLTYLLEDSGFKILKLGYVSTPRISIKFGYPNSNSHENIYCIAVKSKIKKRIESNKYFSIQNFNKLKIIFLLRLALANISYNLSIFNNYLIYFFEILLKSIKSFIRIVSLPITTILFIFINIFNLNK